MISEKGGEQIMQIMKIIKVIKLIKIVKIIKMNKIVKMIKIKKRTDSLHLQIGKYENKKEIQKYRNTDERM